MYRGFILFFFVFFLDSTSLFAQLNFKVGYEMSYQDIEVTNQILQTYNEQKPWLDNSFDDIHFFQSLILGLRYRWEFVGLDLTWQKGFNRKKAEGISPFDDANFKQVIGFSFDRYSVGYENYYQNLGIGASLDYNRYTAKSTINNDSKNRLFKDQNFSSIFHISYTFSNNSAIKFMLKPYVQIPWTKIKLDDLAEGLNQERSQEDLTENTTSYGLMLIFYQGN
ncbi:MAG: hypothetical protein AB8G15_09260 [Saprospiraceae bacterium]